MGATSAFLVDGAQEICDKINDPSVSTPTWTKYLNWGILELHKIIAVTFGDTYFKTIDFTLAPGAYIYQLPDGVLYSGAPAFWDIRGLTLNPDTTNRRRVRRFNFAERDSIVATSQMFAYPFCFDRSYRVVSRKLMYIEPQEMANGTYRVYYVPKPNLLDGTGSPTDVLDDELDPWNEYVMLAAARKALSKEESDISGIDERMSQMKTDIQAEVTTDESGQDSVIDIEGGGRGWGYGGW